ncbi:ankyrin repeat and SOCS box protein 2b [Xyrauchen texanus]|uniref:ankyrin repeat and SOCS box protein 2b n=1 Tax=Xyrauchen texanus TaxID=154827 RepID=UPI002242833F|nr:ankyrin repeat and SOCS box protein 2b [Xyrauchen texanus]
MTRFSYAEYLSLFRSNDKKRHSTLPKPESSTERTAHRSQDGIVCAVQTEDWTDLHEASHCGRIDCVQDLLKARSTCVDKRTLQEQTALLLAVNGEHMECVKCLLEAGADPDICNKHKETPLYKACAQECASVVKLLVAFGASVNQRCRRGRTALHEAARLGNTDLCETLLQAGASIDVRNAYGITPLIEAARHGRTETLTHLIRNGADVNVQSCDGNTALIEACKHGHGEMVKLLLKHHADANKTSSAGLLPLHVATQHGHKQIVSLLLPVTSRARIRQSGITPLHVAAEHDQLNIMSLLIESGCDVNAKLSPECSAAFHDRRVTPLYCAIAARNVQATEILLKAGADPNTDPLRPLLLAVRQGCLRTVTMLVESGADVNTHSPDQSSEFPGVLLYTHHMDVLQYLLDNGCDAHACFTCHKHHSHTAAVSSRDVICTKPKLKFCEWISSSCWSHSAGSVVDLLLDYVGNVQLCSRITEHLQRKQEWPTIQEKTLSPRLLMHLCRLKIREHVGSERLMSVNTLPLPDRVLRYLTSKTIKETGSNHTLKPDLCLYGQTQPMY